MRYLLLAFLLYPVSLMAQQEPSYSRDWSSIEIVLSVGLLIFSLALIGLESLIIIKAKKPWAPSSITKIVGLTLIVTFSALMVVAGYDQDQIAPVTGLLGVIAGYLLGANEQARTSNSPIDPGRS